MRLAASLLLATLTISMSATCASTFLKSDMDFLKARGALRQHGWKPIPMHVNDNYRFDGVEKEFAKRKFVEVDSCSNDSARCVLYYRKTTECIRLDTIGEHLRDMKVVRWTNECPPNQN